MSRIRTTVTRTLLALGGLTALSGSSLAFYRYNLSGERTTKCRPHLAAYNTFKDTENVVSERVGHAWDDDWDRRKSVKQAGKNLNTPSNVVLEQNGRNTNIPVTQPPTADVEPTVTRHVILVRHGQYHQNTDVASEKILTAIGREQAAITGDRLKSLNIKFDKIITSTMVRAHETATIISERIPEVPFSDCCMLREGFPYPGEPSSSSFKPIRWKFFQDNPRIEGAFRRYIHRASPKQEEDSYDLIICHGMVIRYFVCRALQFPPEGWLRMDVSNCGVTWLTIRPNGKVSLRGFGDTGHLTPELITFS